MHLRFYYDEKVSLIVKHFFYLSALYGVFHLFILVDRAFESLLRGKAISVLTYGFLVTTIPRGFLKIEHMAITSLSEVEGSMEKLNLCPILYRVFQPLNWLKPVFGIAILAVFCNNFCNNFKLGIPGICTATFICVWFFRMDLKIDIENLKSLLKCLLEAPTKISTRRAVGNL